MSRVIRFVLLSAVALLSCLVGEPTASAAFTIDVDATALDYVSIRVDGGPQFPVGSIQTVSLDVGPHTFDYPGGHNIPFTVDAAGNVGYDPGFEDFLSGAGTSTLTIDGFDVTVDVSALDYSAVVIGYLANTLDLTGPQTLTLLPDVGPVHKHQLAYHGGHWIQFTVSDDGLVGYDPGYEDFFSGAGTTALTVDGFDVSVDVSALDYSAVVMSWLNRTLDLTGPQTLTLLPDVGPVHKHQLAYHGGHWIQFTVSPDGLIGYDPGFEDFLSGAGTTALTVDGFDVTMDVSALDYAQVNLSWLNRTLDLTGPQTLTLLPDVGPIHKHNFHYPNGSNIPFTVDPDGLIGYDPGYEDFLSGAGTTALTVDGFDVSIDVSALDYVQVYLVWFGFTLDLIDPQTVQLLPDLGPSTHKMTTPGSSSVIPFTIDADGIVDYDSGFDGFLSGSGTTSLTADGCAITVDPRGVSNPTFSINWVAIFPTAAPVDLVLLPDLAGAGHVLQADGGSHNFLVTQNCLISVPPSEVGFLFGDGTDTLTIGFVNNPPTAVAGPDQSIHAGQTVNLDGSGSYDDQTMSAALLYAWTLVTRPVGSNASLTGPSTATPSFVADLPGAYQVQLVVTDGDSESSPPDTVNIASTNVAPTAVAGIDQIVTIDELAPLDGSASSDPEFDGLTFAWTLTSAPVGSAATLVDETTAAPSIIPDLEGTYEVTLVVNDGFEDSLPDTVQVVGVGPVFAQQQLDDACDYVAALPDPSFDAKGHRKSMCNTYAQIIKFIQQGKVDKAVSKLNKAIERVDGCALRGAPDPKGGGQPHAADYLVDCADQDVVYPLLTSALDAID